MRSASKAAGAVRPPVALMRAGLCVLLLAQSARADPDVPLERPPSPEPTEGLWANAALRTGYAYGPHVYTGPADPGYGVTGDLTFENDIGSLVAELSGVLGYALSRELALGAGLDLTLLPTAEASLGESTFAAGYIADWNVVAAWRPAREAPSLRVGLGMAQAGFTGSTNDIGSAYNIVEFERMRGPIGSLGLAWTFGSVGLTARVSYARLSAEHQTFRPVIVSVGVLVEHW